MAGWSTLWSRTLGFGLAVLSPSCRCDRTPTTHAERPRTPVESPCAGDPFGKSYHRRVIETLAQPAWSGRRFDEPGLRSATRWVQDEFACTGLTAGAPGLGLPAAYAQAFTAKGDDLEGYDLDPAKRYEFTNVIGSIPGAGALADEVVVLGAHLDHLGRHGKALLLGADDDASGVLALVALAKDLLADLPKGDRRTLVFAAWAVEEDPFYLRGSRAFLSAVTAPGRAKIVHYVNFDMVGAYAVHETLHGLGAFDGTAARRLLEALPQQGLHVDLGDRGSDSDHQTFCEAGIPYTFFWTEDDCHHRPCDTPDRIDYAHLGPILRLGASFVRTLAVEPGLLADRVAFPKAFAKAFPGKSCASSD